MVVVSAHARMHRHAGPSLSLESLATWLNICKYIHRPSSLSLDMKVAVFGAGGLVGKEVVYQALQRGIHTYFRYMHTYPDTSIHAYI